ncbi:hypothetical protein L873DRAFT_1831381 [Choiromyces venosus 120613-1]|uniref:T6SS Phospholipase effector Tle1-like catalytic domain-containing protein n=1 Tax=Choiromyces venosus 120613-1 TaxID=1336337 RepID=A0A3N4J2V5_9PEZI|nr:hypothetical protein L873DRAFT_1831381 [Choiromyces venosus 120613-1]
MSNSFNDPKPRMKRIIICCDGKLDVPTNVLRVAHTLVNRFVSGGTELSLSEHVREAYGFLAHNYHPGNTIHLFGFSRRAYTARSICVLVCRIDILMKKGMDKFYQVYQDYRTKKNSAVAEPQAREGSSLITPNIKNTNRLLGIPSVSVSIVRNWIAGNAQEKYSFHDTDLSPCVENAFQALTLNEHHGPFTPMLWKKTEDTPTNLKQFWFPSVHTNIGGGYDDQHRDFQQLLPFLQFNDDYLKIITHNNNEHSGGEWATGKIYDSATGLLRLVEETIHKSVWIGMKVVPNWSSSTLKGWT